MSPFSKIVMAMVASMVLFMVAEGGSVGVNFSRQTSQKLLPSMVADMCLANGITKIKFLSINEGVLNAFIRTNIEIFVQIPNAELNYVYSPASTVTWMKLNITRFINTMDLNIRYLSVSNEPFSKLDLVKNDTSYIRKLPQYVFNVQEAVKDEGLSNRLRVTMAHAADILKVVDKPSDGDFREDIKENMLAIIKYLYENDDPFTFNIYPLYYCINDGYPFEFGLFDGKHNISIRDGPYTYTNIFDLKYDTLLHALNRYGYGDMRIIVGQVGWPTDGHVGATVENALRFYTAFLKKIANDEGTPFLRGYPIDAYIYSLADENQKSYARGPFERHYGVYNYDGTPKFNIDFTLQGNHDIQLVTAKGVSFLPHRWCVLNKKKVRGKEKLLQENYAYACKEGDCTPLADGGSCGHLDPLDRISYAFNSLFQQENQDMSDSVKGCDYDGLGMIVEEEPDMGTCIFPIQILSTLFINGLGGEMEAALDISTAPPQLQFDFRVTLFTFCVFFFVASKHI